jgi:gamma-glutamyltranspeptidase
MGDFALPGMNNSFGFAPSQVNFIEPGKRPMSSMILSQVISFNQSLKQAIDGLRLHNQFTPFHTEYEQEFPKVHLLYNEL